MTQLNFSLQAVIPALTDTEHKHLIKLMQDTVFIKYIKALVLTDILNTALAPYDPTEATEVARRREAYNSGRISICNDILESIPVPTPQGK